MLTELVADAARRATEILGGRAAPVDDPVVDLIRLIHVTSSTPAAAQEAAERAGLSSATLNRLRLAYRFGGPEGVRTAHRPHEPEHASLIEACETVRRHHRLSDAAGASENNWITFDASGVQLRLSEQGTWFPLCQNDDRLVTSTRAIGGPSCGLPSRSSRTSK